jgi:hypothetical protein
MLSGESAMGCEELNAYCKSYLDKMDGRIGWFGERADRAHVMYSASRIVLIVLGVIIPVLSSAGDRFKFVDAGVAVTILSMISALIIGLETQFKPGEKWQHFRSAEMALEGIKTEFEYRWALNPDEEGKLKCLTVLFEQAEGLMKAESGTFWQKLVPRSDTK